MKVKFLVCIAGKDFVFKPGDIVEPKNHFSEEEISRFLESKICEPVIEKKKIQTSVKVKY